MESGNAEICQVWPPSLVRSTTVSVLPNELLIIQPLPGSVKKISLPYTGLVRNCTLVAGDIFAQVLPLSSVIYMRSSFRVTPRPALQKN